MMAILCSVDLMVDMILFFSSRRRHTRFDCDWSSDVCSSDLLREANGSRECAPDDRLRDEAIHLSVMPRHGLLRFARNDGYPGRPVPSFSQHATSCFVPASASIGRSTLQRSIT